MTFIGLVGLLSVLAVSTANAAPQDYWPERVIYFVSDSTSEREIRSGRHAARGAEFDVLRLDAGMARVAELERSIPESVVLAGDEAVYQFAKENIVPELLQIAPDIMESQHSTALARIYGVERLPAVVIDGEFVAYGVSVSKAIRDFQWAKYKEEGDL
ncbi:DUF1525 domain-containing protein [Vibrio breoganii]|uniref:DUF1525 domain-containing protein n=1 Tax=Vibrio breoganii TaxID=553239 RepID=UPI000C83437C|nr:DUF1525 domain-containing protein [Vibrio breoganii]PML12723.1 hypothetical protein BCT84_02240 [Vibrio breoganii]